MKKLSKTNVIIGTLAIVLLIIAFIGIRKNNEENKNISPAEVVSTTEQEQASLSNNEQDPKEQVPVIDEEENGEYTGQVVNEETEETAQIINDKEFVDAPSDESYISDLSDEERAALLDTNNDGVLSKKEVIVDGWQYPIVSGTWLYNYMYDPNNDGIIWEDENK